ncbi:hypothetical protein FE257_002451 [Aspergillus nanangensis]|uniref:Uncharacterized protein n=1 Tax=Aspergillus nanangensis TaxID=2582783 RepID=A0AAD4GWU5_ASPNN|nr:hypothetical protein FE257_002451 [Aspergillus nanangensis]
MHASLAVAFTYDRHLNRPSGGRRSLEECYHWSQSTSLLHRRLREPIEPQDKDPIWGTAAALALLSFSSPDARTPEESWPLTPSDHSDLDWIRMIKGKMSLWHIVDPLRPDSLFRVMAATFADMNSRCPNGASMASQGTWRPCILALPDSEVTTGQTQLFMRSIEGDFEVLLQNRDSVALLLLYLWYRKAGRSYIFHPPHHLHGSRALPRCRASRLFVLGLLDYGADQVEAVGDLVGGPLGGAPVEDLAGGEEVVEGAHDLFYGGVAVGAVREYYTTST